MSWLSLVIVGKEITSWKAVSDWRDFLEEIAVSEWSIKFADWNWIESWVSSWDAHSPRWTSTVRWHCHTLDLMFQACSKNLSKLKVVPGTFDNHKIKDTLLNVTRNELMIWLFGQICCSPHHAPSAPLQSDINCGHMRIWSIKDSMPAGTQGCPTQSILLTATLKLLTFDDQSLQKQILTSWYFKFWLWTTRWACPLYHFFSPSFTQILKLVLREPQVFRTALDIPGMCWRDKKERIKKGGNKNQINIADENQFLFGHINGVNHLYGVHRFLTRAAAGAVGILLKRALTIIGAGRSRFWISQRRQSCRGLVKPIFSITY